MTVETTVIHRIKFSKFNEDDQVWTKLWPLIVKHKVYMFTMMGDKANLKSE